MQPRRRKTNIFRDGGLQMKAVMVAGSIALLATCAALLADDVNRMMILKPQGQIASGSVFGVGVGDPRGASVALLRARFGNHDVKRGGRCLGREHGPEFKLDIFYDESWRRGSICTISSNERVVAVEWYFNPFAP